MKNNIIAETSYFTDKELELFHELMEKLIKTRKKVSNEAYQAEAYDIAAKILRAIYARKVSKISFKDHNS